MGNVKMEAGTTLGMRSLVTIKEHSHMDVTNPNLNLIGMLVSSNPAFYNRFSGAYSLGINWQLPKTRHFKLNNFIVAFNYHKAFTRKQEFDILGGEKNVTVGFEKEYIWKGYTQYQRLEFKLYYILFRNKK